MNTCQETSGFLFSHPCGQMAGLTCGTCGKSVCSRHAQMGEAGVQCITCARASAGDSTWGSDDDDQDSPYFYSSRYRSRSGLGEIDANDFQEGDQGAFDKGEGFEDDMGAS